VLVGILQLPAQQLFQHIPPKSAEPCIKVKANRATANSRSVIRYQDFNFNTISIQYFLKYHDIDISINIFLNDQYVNFIQAQEQDVSVQQGSLLYVDAKMCQ